jgi:hypothetical protein
VLDQNSLEIGRRLIAAQRFSGNGLFSVSTADRTVATACWRTRSVRLKTLADGWKFLRRFQNCRGTVR